MKKHPGFEKFEPNKVVEEQALDPVAEALRRKRKNIAMKFGITDDIQDGFGKPQMTDEVLND